jgi:hypothetical protein
MKTLVSLFGWVPVLGQSLKVAYVANCAREVATGIKIDKNNSDLKADELEKHISEMANNAYEENVKPQVDELGLPDFVTNKASEKAIDIISKSIKEKYQQKVS